jgi:hypothetical protein
VPARAGISLAIAGTGDNGLVSSPESGLEYSTDGPSPILVGADGSRTSLLTGRPGTPDHK